MMNKFKIEKIIVILQFMTIIMKKFKMKMRRKSVSLICQVWTSVKNTTNNMIIILQAKMKMKMKMIVILQAMTRTMMKIKTRETM